MRMYFIVRPMIAHMVEEGFERFGPYFKTQEAAMKFANFELGEKPYKILMVEAVVFE